MHSMAWINRNSAFKPLALIVMIIALGAPSSATDLVVQSALQDLRHFRSSDDGRVMAAADFGNMVGIWRDGHLRFTLPGGEVELSRDGRRALVSRARHHPEPSFSISVWDTQTGEKTLHLDTGQSDAAAMAWIDHRFAVLSWDKLRIYSADDGKLLLAIDHDNLTAGLGSNGGLAASHQEGFIAVRSMDWIIAWSLETGRVLFKEPCKLRPYGPSTRFAMSGDSTTLAASCTAEEGNGILLWHTSSGKISKYRTHFFAKNLSLDHRGRRLAADMEYSAHVYELEPRPKIDSKGLLSPSLDRYDASIIKGFALSPSGDQLFVSRGDGSSTIIQLIPGGKESTIGRGVPISEPRFTQKGTTLWGLEDGVMCGWKTFWRVAGEQPVGCVPAGSDDWRPITKLEVTNDGRQLVASHQSFVRVWDLESGGSSIFDGADFALTPDDELLATGPVEGRVEVWQRQGGGKVAELASDTDITHFVASRNGRSFATAATDGTLTTWNAQGEKLREMLAVDAAVKHMLYDAASARLITAHTNGRISGFDLETGAALPAMGKLASGSVRLLEWLPKSDRFLSTGHGLAVWTADEGILVDRARTRCGQSSDPLAILDEMRLVVAGASRHSCFGVISLETPETGTCLREHEGWLSTIEARGDWLATGDSQGQVYVWRAEDGSNLLELPSPTAERVEATGHYGRVDAIAWDPKGRFLAVADQGGVIWLWNAKGRLLAKLVAPSPTGWTVLTGDGRWESSEGAPPWIVAWIDEQPQPLESHSEWLVHGLLAKILNDVDERFPSGR